jgi:multidrug resistance protein
MTPIIPCSDESTDEKASYRSILNAERAELEHHQSIKNGLITPSNLEPQSGIIILPSQTPESLQIPQSEPTKHKFTIFSKWEKRCIVLGAATMAVFSPLTTQIYLPAINNIAADLRVSSTQINLTITTYLIFQGLVPMFVGGFSDNKGRRPAYLICFMVYIVANIALAEAKSYAAVLGLRCLQAAGISTTQSLCQAVVADIITSAERGQYIGIISMPAVLGPTLGPLLGGILAQYLGWHSIFWGLAVCAGIVLVVLLLFFPETCRNIVGDGSIRPTKLTDTIWYHFKSRIRSHGDNQSPEESEVVEPKKTFGVRNLVDALVILCDPEMALLCAYGGLIYGGTNAVYTALPNQFALIYGFNSIEIGLMFLPVVGGTIVAVVAVGWGLNWNYRRHAKKSGLDVDKGKQMDLANFPIEQARLEVAIPLLPLAAVVIVGWGWALESRASLAVPCVLGFMLGIGYIGMINVLNALISDLYRKRAASAIAGNWFIRCLITAGMSAMIEPLILAVGAGWAYTIIGLSYIVFAPMGLLVAWKGLKWRRAKENNRQRKLMV